MGIDLVYETYSLVRVERLHNGAYSLQMPTRREIQARFTELGVRAAVPEPESQFYRDVAAKVRDNMQLLRSIADRLYVQPTPNITRASDRFSVSRFNPTQTGAEALAECQRLGIQVVPHPTNKGITAMRAKNALRTHHSRS